MPPSQSAAASPTKAAIAKASYPVLSLAQARARWHFRQGLASPSPASLAAVVEATSWPRTLGGIDVYLALRARVAGLRRADLDAAVQRCELRVVPAVRGCIYLVPRAQVALCLRVAEDQWRPRTDREIQKVGITWSEINEVSAAIVTSLASGPLTTDGVRRALPKGFVRSTGDAAKKQGISSPLPLALRELEFAGHIERTLPSGRLDTERYEWRLTTPRPPSVASPVPATAAERNARLAAIFFAGAAPATVKDFAEWAGLGQRDARAAIASLAVSPVQVPGYADEAFAFADDLAVAAPSQRVAFLPSEDNYLTMHGGPAVLVDPAQHGRALPVWGSTRGSTLGDAKYISMRPLLSGPHLIGFWEYDPDAQRVVWATFQASDSRDLAAQRDAAEPLTTFLRDELTHGRSFSLDTDDALRQRTTLVQQVSGYRA